MPKSLAFYILVLELPQVWCTNSELFRIVREYDDDDDDIIMGRTPFLMPNQ